ncbi:phosphate acyltransferase [Staphylococcus lutrae]|uniref:phosphate acyltransferase n=1 Tax=Staphylococcus lutrae TaxID=155085 RepID=UPI001F0BD16F|nr:phosphate acyltransferase [Staphylococcus lutrae]
MDGTIALVNATTESLISVMVEVLKRTNANFKLYNHQDITVLIRTFNLAPELLTRIQVNTFETEEAALERCLDDLKDNQADILMKGQITSAQILSVVLKRHAHDKKTFLNHIALFEIPSYHKLLMISDVALNIEPTENDTKAMIQNIVHFSKRLQYNQLYVALLSSVEKVNQKIPSTVKAAQVVQHFKTHPIDENVYIDGPFALDNAIDQQSAIQKGIQSVVAGQADVLIVPSIDVGNVLYKSLTYFGQAKVASLILGAQFPIVLTSRADRIENKINSILIALKLKAC